MTPLNAFIADNGFAGVVLLTDETCEFAAKMERVRGEVVFAPGRYALKGSNRSLGVSA